MQYSTRLEDRYGKIINYLNTSVLHNSALKSGSYEVMITDLFYTPINNLFKCQKQINVQKTKSTSSLFILFKFSYRI